MTEAMLDIGMSNRIANRIKARTTNNCWSNSFKAITNLPQLNAAYYVEGWAVSRDTLIVTEHSWLELAGKVIDPTAPSEFVAYFSGISLSKTLLEAMNLDIKDLPVYSSQYHCSHRGYSQAYQEALKYTKKVALNKQI